MPIMKYVEFFRNVILSLTGGKEGFSFRKLCSLVILLLVVFMHVKYVSSDNVLNFLLYDFAFISVLLGLLNLDKFIQTRWGKNSDSDDTQGRTQ